jgi:hypothetical protein
MSAALATDTAEASQAVTSADIEADFMVVPPFRLHRCRCVVARASRFAAGNWQKLTPSRKPGQ